MTDATYSAEVHGNKSIAKKEYSSGTTQEVRLCGGFADIFIDDERVASFKVDKLDKTHGAIGKMRLIETDGALTNYGPVSDEY